MFWIVQCWAPGGGNPNGRPKSRSSGWKKKGKGKDKAYAAAESSSAAEHTSERVSDGVVVDQELALATECALSAESTAHHYRFIADSTARHDSEQEATIVHYWQRDCSSSKSI
jgi:hypothetical protein